MGALSSVRKEELDFYNLSMGNEAIYMIHRRPIKDAVRSRYWLDAINQTPHTNDVNWAVYAFNNAQVNAIIRDVAVIGTGQIEAYPSFRLSSNDTSPNGI